VPTLAFDSKGHYVSSGTAAITLPAAPSNATTAATGVVKLVTGDMNGKSHANGQAPSLNHTHSQYQAAGSYLSGNTTYAVSDSVGGDAKKAVQLTNTRTIWGQNFNGTANVSGNMTGVGSITMTGDIAGAQNISAAKKVNVGSSAIQYNATTGCMEIIC
jgi:hypothetical protein